MTESKLSKGSHQKLVSWSIGESSWEDWEAQPIFDDGLPDIENFADITEEDLIEKQEVIKGLLRRGSKLVLGASSKGYKTWCPMDLALSVAEGDEWMGKETVKGKVLYINFELQKPTFNQRAINISEAKRIDAKSKNLDIWHLRGYAAAIEDLAHKIIQRAKSRDYVLIILDPTYKMLGRRVENDAGDMADLMNHLERLATQVDAAVAFAAHFSKSVFKKSHA